MSTDQEYETQHSRSILEDPEQDELGSHRSPELQGSYPPQFGHGHAQQSGEFYPQAQGMQTGADPQIPQQAQFEQSHMGPPANQAGASDGQYDVDPSDPMLDADPFGLSASMHYPTSYSFDQHQGQR